MKSCFFCVKWYILAFLVLLCLNLTGKLDDLTEKGREKEKEKLYVHMLKHTHIYLRKKDKNAHSYYTAGAINNFLGPTSFLVLANCVWCEWKKEKKELPTSGLTWYIK